MHGVAAAAIPWDVIVSTIGTAAATIIGVIVGGAIGSRAQTRHWALTAQSEACANVLREYTSIYLQLAAACREDRTRHDASIADWEPWNQALAVLNLVGDERIVAAAHGVDAVFWQVNLGMRHGRIVWDQWPHAREPMENARLEFINAARKQLGKDKQPLRQLLGRPPDSDPIWQPASAIVSDSLSPDAPNRENK